MSAEALANASPKSYFTSVNTGIYVVMGVSGSGKSLIGSRLARAIGIEFVEGDDFHPAENIERMSSGIPLTDFHRAGWLGAIGRRLRVAADAGAGVVVSCSALKRSYRDMLRADTNNVQFIFLQGSQDVIADRASRRDGEHFMPSSLLDTQFATLEEPSQDESVWVCDIRESPEKIVADLIARASESAEVV